MRFDQSEVVFDSVVNEFWLSNKHQNMATYKCDPCQKSYASKLNLDKHMKVFHLPGSVQCTFCGKEFKIQTYLDYHIQITHKAVDGEFKCKFCPKICKSKISLKGHEKQVHGPKNKACDKCDQKFTTFSDLKKHRNRIHLKIMKFNCDICNKNLASKMSLKNHKDSVHEGKKSYKCELCLKSFTQSIH